MKTHATSATTSVLHVRPRSVLSSESESKIQTYCSIVAVGLPGLPGHNENTLR